MGCHCSGNKAGRDRSVGRGKCVSNPRLNTFGPPQKTTDYLLPSGMAWEEISRKTHACPCGKGMWVEVTRSDDWGSSEESASLSCVFCQATYRVQAEHRHDKGIPITTFVLVAREPDKTV